MVVPPLPAYGVCCRPAPWQLYGFWARAYRPEEVLALLHAASGNLWWKDLSILRNTPVSIIHTVTNKTYLSAPEGRGISLSGQATGGAPVRPVGDQPRRDEGILCPEESLTSVALLGWPVWSKLVLCWPRPEPTKPGWLHRGARRGGGHALTGPRSRWAPGDHS